MKNKNNKKNQKLNGSLNHSTETALKKYFKTLNGHKPINLYKFVIKEVERPLMKEVMKYTENNQSEAAKILGINRTTLRNKLKQYKII
ncbi:MAG: Fis family transcriptional regulator [Gammaproteobacteria bacterium]|nr:Fis family transcriptional regulator [Gammaproteobacteria bacterium]MDG2297759.1 helix-turn-helix domain-containing protein [Gammaproteobacteria bacterium]